MAVREIRGGKSMLKTPEYDSTILELIPILPKLSEDKKKELVAYAESLTKDEEEESDIESTKKNISKCICFIIAIACFCGVNHIIAFLYPKMYEVTTKAQQISLVILKWAGRFTIIFEVFLFAILCLEIYSLHLLKNAEKEEK